jgi:hypothetical protein
MTVEHPGFYTSVVVSFPAAPHASSVTVSLPVSGRWLNVPAGAYPIASITPSTPILLCEVEPQNRA